MLVLLLLVRVLNPYWLGMCSHSDITVFLCSVELSLPANTFPLPGGVHEGGTHQPGLGSD